MARMLICLSGTPTDTGKSAAHEPGPRGKIGKQQTYIISIHFFVSLHFALVIVVTQSLNKQTMLA